MGAENILSIKDIPENFKLTPKQKIQRECAISGNEHIEKEKIKEFMDKLTYPISYLDFEFNLFRTFPSSFNIRKIQTYV